MIGNEWINISHGAHSIRSSAEDLLHVFKLLKGFNFVLNGLMTGFEPRTSGVWSNRSSNWATSSADFLIFLSLQEIAFIRLMEHL